MTMTCADLGPPPGCRLPAAKPECEGWIVGLQDRYGEPPAGAHFWTPVDGDGFRVQLCYDPNNSKHLEYAAILN